MGTKVAMLAALAAGVASAQPKSWLDTARPANWNQTGSAIPKAPATENQEIIERCAREDRPAASAEDRAVLAAGWRLMSALQIFGPVTVVEAYADVDGMCRPLNYQGFVFSNGKLAGTISPSPMHSRTDGSSHMLRLFTANRLMVRYQRYSPRDPMCCPSRTTSVVFTVRDSLLTPEGASTEPNPQQ